MPLDLHVLSHAILYFVISVFGFAVAIPLGVTVIEFGNHCILYTEWTWVNATFGTYLLKDHSVCNFPVYFAVIACILYGLGMGIYHLYAVCSSKDPNIGFQMWVMPFLLLNALVLLTMFIVCCIISVGLKSMCDSLLAIKEKGGYLQSCSDGVKLNWNLDKKTDYTYKHFYSYPKASEISAWITFLLWAAQESLYILRVIRNRRRRLQGLDLQSDNASPKTPSDLDNFASVKPTA